MTNGLFGGCFGHFNMYHYLKFINFVTLHIVLCGCPGVDAKKYPTVELIRRKNAGEPLEDSEDKNALPRGKHTWTGGNCNCDFLGCILWAC